MIWILDSSGAKKARSFYLAALHYLIDDFIYPHHHPKIFLFFKYFSTDIMITFVHENIPVKMRKYL